MKTLIILFGSVLWALGFSVAEAATVTLYYSTAITDITHTSGGYGDTSGYLVGGTSHGVISFNDDATDTNSSNRAFQSSWGVSPIPLNISMSSTAGQSSHDITSAMNGNISIFNDGVSLITLAKFDGITFSTRNAQRNTSMNLSLSQRHGSSESFPTLISSIDFDLSTLDLNAPGRPIENTFSMYLIEDPIGGTGGRTDIEGRVTYLSTVPPSVPLPATVWLFGSCLLGLICASRRKNTV